MALTLPKGRSHTAGTSRSQWCGLAWFVMQPRQSDATFELIVIGAGINGAAIAREAALAGLKVLVVERGDVGGGTSSASSRLIHGGLRYLEYGELGLVYESLHERERLLRLAPHLVAPLELVIPVYRSARRPRWQIALGLALYDLLSIGRSVPGRTLLGSRRVARAHAGAESARARRWCELLRRSGALSRAARRGECARRRGQRRGAEDEDARHSCACRGRPRGRRRVARGGRREPGGAARAADRERGGAVGRRSARADSAHAAARRHERQPRDRAAVSRRAAYGRVRGGGRGRSAVLHPAVERVAADRHHGRALRRRRRCAAIDSHEIAYLTSETERVFPGAAGLADRVLYTHTRNSTAAVAAAGSDGRNHASARDSTASLGARPVFGGRRQAHDASRAGRGRAAQGARRAAATDRRTPDAHAAVARCARCAGARRAARRARRAAWERRRRSACGTSTVAPPQRSQRSRRGRSWRRKSTPPAACSWPSSSTRPSANGPSRSRICCSAAAWQG